MTVYKSKIDAWLAVVLIAAMAISAYAALSIFFSGPASAWWIALLTGGVGLGLPLAILLSTRYTLGTDALVVRCGPFKWSVPMTQITGITPTSSSLSSPALSLDRLRIDYGRHKFLIISPRDKKGFLRQIESLRRGAG
jgi:hypothetical protein